MQLPQQNHSENSEQQTFVQPASPNLFSLAWSKVANLFQTSQLENQSEDIETTLSSEPSQEQDLRPHVVDRVDPSFYYAIFFMPYY